MRRARSPLIPFLPFFLPFFFPFSSLFFGMDISVSLVRISCSRLLYAMNGRSLGGVSNWLTITNHRYRFLGGTLALRVPSAGG